VLQTEKKKLVRPKKHKITKRIRTIEHVFNVELTKTNKLKAQLKKEARLYKGVKFCCCEIRHLH